MPKQDAPYADHWREVAALIDGQPPDSMSRRDFLALVGAGAALAGLNGCAQEPRDPILPYSKMAPDAVPGKTLHYATSMVLDGFATGLIVTSHEGRPTKVEGNPAHPASLGATSVFEQAALLDLYDPGRGRSILQNGAPRSYEHFVASLGPPDEPLALLLEPTSSPLVADLLARVKARRPNTSVYFHAPLDRSSSVLPLYDLSQARVIVSIDCDFLGRGAFATRYARQFADGRRLEAPTSPMNRLYIVESTLSVTGMTADHRFARKPTEVQEAAIQLLRELVPPAAASTAPGWIRAIARDLQRNAGQAVVLAGEHLPPEIHAAVQLINEALGSTSVRHVASPILDAGLPNHDLRTLARAIESRQVQHLVVLEGNPVGTASADVDFGALLSAVPHAVHAGLVTNETSAHAEWYLPTTHFLESWGDARAADGTLSLIQPLISPLYSGKSIVEILAALAGEPSARPYELLRNSWQTRLAASGVTWDQVVQRGFLEGTSPPVTIPRAEVTAWKPAREAGIEVQWRPSYTMHDGRFGNNAWLHELPDPVSKQTWGNAAWLSPATAARLGIEEGRQLRLSRAGRSIVIPALIVPGHADDALTLPLGSAIGGELARSTGVDTYRLRTSDVAHDVAAVSVEVLGTTEQLAMTHTHWSMEGRPIALSTTLAQLPHVHATGETIATLYDAFPGKESPQWGMAIDLSVCTGCSACVVACQAENNIPVVGREGVLTAREMHWIRINHYFTDDAVINQPMLCQHCEKAPCEYVCPVNATTHSPDGINEMTYNRCVGTRFCQNNCPYKVRRFNWFDYNRRPAPSLKMLTNPDVTVRARGVIEKCTYCIQRIRGEQITAQVQERPLGDVRTACQQACPTGAIVFGNIADPNSAVSRQMRLPRLYSVLEELGTKPRTRYLTRVKNLDPELG